MDHRGLARFAALAAAALFSGAAGAQQVPAIRSIVTIDGSCERLTSPGEDRSARCGAGLLNLNYPNGRSSYAFNDGGLAMVSFSGMGGEVTDGPARLAIDLVTVAADGGRNVVSEPATGTCEVGDVRSGRAAIRCTARTASGEFSGSFTTDGSAPQVHRP